MVAPAELERAQKDEAIRHEQERTLVVAVEALRDLQARKGDKEAEIQARLIAKGANSLDFGTAGFSLEVSAKSSEIFYSNLVPPAKGGEAFLTDKTEIKASYQGLRSSADLGYEGLGYGWYLEFGDDTEGRYGHHFVPVSSLKEVRVEVVYYGPFEFP